jgi:hypothetical protein
VSFWSDSYGLRPSVVIGAIALVLVALLFFAIRADMKFARFVEKHNCKAIAQDPGFYITTLMPMSCGNGCTTVMPILTWVEGAKTWRCDGMEDFKR